MHQYVNPIISLASSGVAGSRLISLPMLTTIFTRLNVGKLLTQIIRRHVLKHLADFIRCMAMQDVPATEGEDSAHKGNDIGEQLWILALEGASSNAIFNDFCISIDKLRFLL